ALVPIAPTGSWVAVADRSAGDAAGPRGPPCRRRRPTPALVAHVAVLPHRAAPRGGYRHRRIPLSHSLLRRVRTHGAQPPGSHLPAVRRVSSPSRHDGAAAAPGRRAVVEAAGPAAP